MRKTIPKITSQMTNDTCETIPCCRHSLVACATKQTRKTRRKRHMQKNNIVLLLSDSDSEAQWAVAFSRNAAIAQTRVVVTTNSPQMAIPVLSLSLEITTEKNTNSPNESEVHANDFCQKFRVSVSLVYFFSCIMSVGFESFGITRK